MSWYKLLQNSPEKSGIKSKQSAEECTALLKKSNYFGTMLVKMI